MTPITRETARHAVTQMSDAVATLEPAEWSFTEDAAEALGQWIDEQLFELEERFATFRTRGSIRSSLKGDRSRT